MKQILTLEVTLTSDKFMIDLCETNASPKSHCSGITMKLIIQSYKFNKMQKYFKLKNIDDICFKKDSAECKKFRRHC